MKKKRVLVLMCLALVLVIATVLVACNNTTTYTVTFSGDGIDTITKTVEEGNTVTPPSDITKEGYDAVWQLNGEDYDFSKAVNSDLTLSLKWVGKKYNVTLNTGGGQLKALRCRLRSAALSIWALPLRRRIRFLPDGK